MLKYSFIGMCMARYQVFGLRADGGAAAGANHIDIEHASSEAVPLFNLTIRTDEGDHEISVPENAKIIDIERMLLQQENVVVDILLFGSEELDNQLLLTDYGVEDDATLDARTMNPVDSIKKACRVGDVARVRELLQNGIDPNRVITPNGHSALYLAVVNGRGGLVRMLIEEFGVDPNGDPARDRHSPLFEALRRGHEGLARMLIEELGFDPNGDPDRDPWSPLAQAIHDGQEGLVRMMFEEFGVDLNGDPARDQHSLLFEAVNDGHEGLVRMMVQECGVDPNGDPWFGDPCFDPRSPEFQAISLGHEQVRAMGQEFAVDLNVDPNRDPHHYYGIIIIFSHREP